MKFPRTIRNTNYTIAAATRRIRRRSGRLIGWQDPRIRRLGLEAVSPLAVVGLSVAIGHLWGLLTEIRRARSPGGLDLTLSTDQDPRCRPAIRW
jgi:hypothetical protein